MEKIVRFALAVLFLLGIASAQNIPAIDLFGGYSYLNFNVPSSNYTTAQRLSMQGWDAAASVAVLHHLAIEIDIAGHTLSDCGGTTGLNCDDFSYMFGPRYNFGDRTKKITAFVHGLVGEDRATLGNTSDTATNSTTDSSVALAAGGGIDYWLGRRFGVQIGPGDIFYTHHLNAQGVNGQDSYRVAGGIVFRFGGELPEPAPKGAPLPPPSVPTQSRSRRGRGESEPTPIAGAPAGVVNVPGKGMSIIALGAVVAPQEFDGARVVDVAPGGVAEMASLKSGDLIKSVDGKAVRTPMELAAELSDKSGKVHIGIQRGDFATEMVILLGTH
jgi:membrane-associated protease RseP (regulator of RpoE activity)